MVRKIGIFSKAKKAVQKMYSGYYQQQLLIPPNLNTADYLRSYGEIGWLFACVSKIAQNVSEPEWSAYKGDKEFNGSKALEVLNKPNAYMSHFELMELTDMYMSLTGKAFWYVAKDKVGRPREIWPISPMDIWVVPDIDNFIKGYIYKAGAQQIPLDASEVIFFKMPNPYNPYDGVGPAQGARYSLETDKYSAESNRNFFFNGCKLSGILNIEQNMDDIAYDRLKAEFEDRHRGMDNFNKMGFIEGGKANFLNLSLSQKDMDFFNLRNMSRDEILGTFGVHKSILGLTDDVSRANAETAEYVFQKHVVKPRLKRIQDKLNSEFVKMFNEDIILKFTDPVPENKEFIVATVNTLVNKSITINESRKILDKLLDEVSLEPIEGGDVIYQAMALVPLGTLPQLITPTEPTKEEPQVDNAKKKIDKSFYNDLDKEAYWKSFVQKTDKFEKDMKPVWEKIFDSQKDKIISKLKTKKSIKAMNIDDILKFLQSDEEYSEMADTIIPMLKKIVADKGSQVIDELNVSTSFNLHDPKVTAWLEKYCGDQIKYINSTTKDLIKNQLVEGQGLGESIPKLMNRINDYCEGMKISRIESIARTEVIGASNNATLLSYIQSGVVKGKQWLTALDGREREWHAEADGQKVDVDENFTVDGEELDCPGGMGGSAENVINCRCTMIPIVN